MAHSIALGGIALHTGAITSVVLGRHDGALVVEQGGRRVPLSELCVVRTDHGVTVSDRSRTVTIDLIEHLMAAVGGLGISSALRMTVRGAEVPLLDGGARRLTRALESLRIPPASPRLRIDHPFEVDLAGSKYSFAPSDRTRIEVKIEADHPLIEVKSASWDGTPRDFSGRVAPARTFGFLSDAQSLSEAGRARGVDLQSVVVLCDDGSTLSNPGPEPDECARHKLLDMIGDLTLLGGVPLGHVRAWRPGHGATHEAVRRAKEARALIAA